MKNAEDRNSIQWEIDALIFTNKFILRDMAIAVGIPFGILIMFLLYLAAVKSDSGAGYAIVLIGLLFLISVLFIMLFYGGKYDAGYIINSKGILNYTQKKQAKRNLVLNSLLVIIGLLTRRPGTAGTGLLAQSRQSVFIKWSSIKKVKMYPKSRTIIVRGGFTEKIAIFCTEENYNTVELFIRSEVPKLFLSKHNPG